MKKRLLCTMLAFLMLAVLLPAFGRSAEASGETHISAFTLTTTGDFVTPKAGDPVYYPSDRISVTSTTPNGLESALQISTSWSGPYTSFYEGSGFEGVFTPGTWQLYVYVRCASSDSIIDYDNEHFGYGGDLNKIVLGGKTFRIGACGDSYIGYYAEFEVDSAGVAPMFVTSFDETVNTGDACNRNLVALGEAPITYSLKSGTLPYGTTLSEDGLLSGTFTTAGTFHFTVEAANAIGSATQDCTITVRAVTRIKAFTLSITDPIPTPIVGRSLFFPDDYIAVTSTIPAGNEAGLEIETSWYNHTTGESIYGPSTREFTEDEWEFYVFVKCVNEDYVIDYEEYFSGGSLSRITLGGHPFWTNSLSSSYVGYSTTFYLGTTPETIDLKYSTFSFPEITDQMTGKEAYDKFARAIQSRRGPSYYECSSGTEADGWYVDTDSGYVGFSDDSDDPAYLNDSEVLLVPQDPYYITFDVGLAPGCTWHANQKFTVNGSDDVQISNYEDADGNEHYVVSYQIICKEDLSNADVYGIEPKNYTGSAITQPNLKVVCDGKTLQEGVHYVVQYEDNIEPGDADIYITGVGNYTGNLYRGFKIFDADHPHTVIDTLAATSDIDEILVYGGEVTTPTFTVTSGAPAYFNAVYMGHWDKLIDGEWMRIDNGGRFSSGQWRYSCQLRIDSIGDDLWGEQYTFSNWPKCFVDGVQWEVSSRATINDDYCYTYTASPVFTVTGSGELIFNNLDSYSIGQTYVNEPITPFSVSGSVDGGTPPYTFSKTSGPDWITVSSDGMISGTPNKTGRNDNLVVRVTDSADEYAEIKLYVDKTAKKQEDKTVISKIVATSNTAEMAVPGHTIDYPDFTVTEGLPAYFAIGMGAWYKKVGEEWVRYSYGESFTDGIWQFSCQIRIDDGGEDYVISDYPTVIVDGVNWTPSGTTSTGPTYCYLYAASPEIKVQSHPDTCTVTFDPDGGSAVAAQTVEYNTPAAKPADPKKSGYTFKGWYLGSTPYDFTTPVTEDITLKAKWEKIPTPPKFEGTVELNPSDVQFNGKTPYVTYNKKAQTPRVIVKDKGGKTVAASKYTVTYRSNTNPGTAYADVKMKDTGSTASVWFKIYLPPTTSTSVQNVNNGIQISWAKVDGAKGYVIYRRAWNLVDKGWTTFERWNNTTQTTWTDTKVYAGTRYQYGIKAYFNDPMDNYNLGVVGPLKTTVRITTRTLNSVTPGSKKLTAKWSGSTVFTGYQVQVATDAKFTKDVKTVTINKAKTYETTVKGLKARTTYYVRMRSYHIFEGMTYYGGWSNVKNGKTK